MKFDDFLLHLFAILVVLLASTAMFAVGVLVLVWAWNTLLSGVFHLPTLSYIHGVALAVLLGTLRSAVEVVVTKGSQ